MPTDTSPAPESAGEPSLVANAAIAWSLFAGRAVLSLVITVLVARELGPAGRGEVTYVVNLGGLLALVATAGTGVSMIALVVARRCRPEELYSAAIRVGLMFGGVIVVVTALAAVASAQHRQQLLAVGIGALPLVLQSNLHQAAGLDNRLGAVTWTSLLGVSAYALGTVVTVVTHTATVRNNIALWTGSWVLTIVLLLVAVRDRITPTDRAVVADLWRRSLRTSAAAAAVLAIWRIDVVLVQLRRGYTELGLYSVAVGVAEILVTMAIGLRSAVLPHQSLDDRRLIDVICRATRLTLVGLVIMAVVMGATAPWTLPLVFGQAYAHTAPALMLLLPGVVCFVLHYPLFDFISGRGGTRPLTVLALAALALNIVVNLIALGHFDYTAAALTSSATYAVLFAGCVMLFVRQTGRTMSDVLVARADDLRAARTAIVSFVRR